MALFPPERMKYINGNQAIYKIPQISNFYRVFNNIYFAAGNYCIF